MQCICHSCLIHWCDMACLIHWCDTTPSCVWHVIFTLCDTHFYVIHTSMWYTLLYEATYLYIHAFVTAHSYMYDSSFIHVWLLFHTYIRASHRHPTMHLQDFKHPIPWCNMTHLYIQHVSMIHVKRLWNVCETDFLITFLNDSLVHVSRMHWVIHVWMLQGLGFRL